VSFLQHVQCRRKPVTGATQNSVYLFANNAGIVKRSHSCLRFAVNSNTTWRIPHTGCPVSVNISPGNKILCERTDFMRIEESRSVILKSYNTSIRLSQIFVNLDTSFQQSLITKKVRNKTELAKKYSLL